MGRTYGTDGQNRPTDLIGQVVHAPLPIEGSAVGVRVVRQEESVMRKAPYSGEYTLNGNYFVAHEGQPLPDGAEMVPQVTEEAPGTRARKAAPENKAKPAAPETKD